MKTHINYLSRKSQNAFEKIAKSLDKNSFDLSGTKPSPARREEDEYGQLKYSEKQIASYNKLTKTYLNEVERIIEKAKPLVLQTVLEEAKKTDPTTQTNDPRIIEIMTSALSFFASDIFYDSANICANYTGPSSEFEGTQFDIFMRQAFTEINQKIKVDTDEVTRLSQMENPAEISTQAFVHKLTNKKEFESCVQAAVSPEYDMSRSGRVFNKCMGGEDKETTLNQESRLTNDHTGVASVATLTAALAVKATILSVLSSLARAAATLGGALFQVFAAVLARNLCDTVISSS